MSDDVLIRMPAQPHNLVLIRQVAAVMATQAEMTADIVDDARLLADEAMTQLITWGAHEVALSIGAAPQRLDLVMVGIGARHGDVNELGWTVITALASHAEISDSDGEPSITMRIGDPTRD